MQSVADLSWLWIALMLIVPPVLGVVVAYPCWRKHEVILGNVAGTLVIFGAALALILRESVEIDRVTRGCLEAGFTCWPQPSAFARYAVYAGVALLEVFALFGLSLKVEHKIRRRHYAPEWR